MLNDKSMLAIDVNAKEWQEAVKVGIELLEKNGYVSDAYYQGVLDITEEFGPYYVIAPGIAMPHARPEAGAIKTGVSFVRLETPVDFHHEDMPPVDLLFCLAASDSNSHIQLISQIATLIEDDEKLGQLRTLTDSHSIVELLS